MKHGWWRARIVNAVAMGGPWVEFEVVETGKTFWVSGPWGGAPGVPFDTRYEVASGEEREDGELMSDWGVKVDAYPAGTVLEFEWPQEEDGGGIVEEGVEVLFRMVG